MVSSSSRRRAIQESIEKGLGGVAQACRAVRLSRSGYYRTRGQRPARKRLRARVLRLSQAHPRYGYRRITVLRRRAGERVNAKRVQRIRRLEGLQVRKRQRRTRRAALSTSVRQSAQHANHVWSWDFVQDQTENGTPFRILTLIDEYTREWLAVHVAWSIRAVDVITVVEAAFARYGTPAYVRSDNGPSVHCLRHHRLAGGQGDPNQLHHAWLPVGAGAHRELPRQAARRVAQPGALRQPLGGESARRRPPPGIQRRASAQFAGRPNAGGVCRPRRD